MLESLWSAIDKLDRLTGDGLTDAIDNGTTDLVFRSERIDDLASDVACHPDLVNVDRLTIDAKIDHFGEIATMTEIECEALGALILDRAVRPIGFGYDPFYHLSSPARIEWDRRTVRISRRDKFASFAKQRQHKGREVACRRMGHLVEKRLKGKACALEAGARMAPVGITVGIIDCLKVRSPIKPPPMAKAYL